jgi:acyl dehydratase
MRERPTTTIRPISMVVSPAAVRRRARSRRRARKRLATDAVTLHGEHDITFHRPIVPGMTLDVEAKLVGVRATAAGTTLIIHGITRADDGLPVNEQYLVNIAHGRRLAEDAGAPAPDHRLPVGLRDAAPLARVTYDLDADQTRRYAEASGDRDPYTFDAEEAKRRGLPGPIVHGLCTMAFVSRAVVAAGCAGDSRRLRRLRCGSPTSMMMPWPAVDHDRVARGPSGCARPLRVRGRRSRRDVVIRHGWAEIDDGEGELGRDGPGATLERRGAVERVPSRTVIDHLVRTSTAIRRSLSCSSRRGSC